ncbi:hypothetical protein BDZ89DRAFT_1142113 [Hymenopellis radicata]|nr:hypothetical protein BDZ89DRAFT_1142113 [Hymenopellis radicata]
MDTDHDYDFAEFGSIVSSSHSGRKPPHLSTPAEERPKPDVSTCRRQLFMRYLALLFFYSVTSSIKIHVLLFLESPIPYWLGALDVFETGENLPRHWEDWCMAIVWGRTLVALGDATISQFRDDPKCVAAQRHRSSADVTMKPPSASASSFEAFSRPKNSFKSICRAARNDHVATALIAKAADRCWQDTTTIKRGPMESQADLEQGFVGRWLGGGVVATSTHTYYSQHHRAVTHCHTSLPPTTATYTCMLAFV